MDKISGIIPSSPRLTSVDLKDSAVRPGTPLFGRAEGSSSLKAASIPAFAVPTTTAQRSTGVHQELMDWRSKDQRSAAMAAELSNRFFMKPTPPPPAEQGLDVTNGAGAYAAGMPIGFNAVESRPTGFKTEDLTAPRSTVRPPEPMFEDEEDGETMELQQPEGLYPKGSFIDRTA